LAQRLRRSNLSKVLNTLVLRGLGSGLAVLLTLLVVRYLAADAAASFLLVFNVTTVAAICFRWGLDDVIVRRVAAELHSETSRRSVSYLMKLAHRRVAIWTVVAGVGVAIIAVTKAAPPASEANAQELFNAVAISALIALTSCAGRVHQGQARTDFAAFILNILVPGLLLLGLLAMVAFHLPVSSLRLQLVYAGVALLTYVGIVWAIPVTRPHRARSPEERQSESARAKLDRRAANKLGGVVLSQQALNWAALLVVPIAYGDELFTSFMVTYKLSLLISLIMLAINFTFASRLAGHYAKAEFRELQRLTKLMVVSVAASSALAAAAVFFTRGFVSSFADVDSSDTMLTLLVGAQALFAISAVYALVLTMCHDEAFLLKTQGAVVGAGVILFSALSLIASLDVACTAFPVTYLLLALVLGRRVHTVTKG
jgi:uncharacterized membrane protein YhaH (DUF805 family)